MLRGAYLPPFAVVRTRTCTDDEPGFAQPPSDVTGDASTSSP
jgi:hypothetical protein